MLEGSTVSLDRPLSPIQQKFAEEYLKDMSSGRAALRAGYSPPSAAAIGSRLLKDPRIKKILDEATESATLEMGVNKLRVLQELSRIAFANVKDIIRQDPNTGDLSVDINSINYAHAAGIAEVTITTAPNGYQTTKVKLIDKNTALEKLGKHLSLFKDQIEVTGNVNLLSLVEASIGQRIDRPSSKNEIEGTFTEVPKEIDSVVD